MQCICALHSGAPTVFARYNTVYGTGDTASSMLPHGLLHLDNDLNAQILGKATRSGSGYSPTADAGSTLSNYLPYALAEYTDKSSYLQCTRI